MKLKKTNALLKGYSGKFGELFILKQHKGDTIMTALPSVPPKPTPARLACRKRFREAVAFARVVIRHPELAEILGIRTKRDQYLYHAAIQAYPRLKEKDPAALNAALAQIRSPQQPD